MIKVADEERKKSDSALDLLQKELHNAKAELNKK